MYHVLCIGQRQKLCVALCKQGSFLRQVSNLRYKDQQSADLHRLVGLMTHLLTAYLTMLPHNFSRSWSARKVIHISPRQISGKLPEHTTRKAVKSLSIAASSRDPWSQAIGKHVIIIAMEQHILSILHTEQEFTCCLTDNIKVSASGRKERHNVLLPQLLFPFQYRRHQFLDLRHTHHIWHSQSLIKLYPQNHLALPFHRLPAALKYRLQVSENQCRPVLCPPRC